MANKLELVSLGGIPHCYNHNVYTLHIVLLLLCPIKFEHAYKVLCR